MVDNTEPDGPVATGGPAVPGNKPNLLDKVREVIRVKHYSIRTEEAYVHWVKRFVLFHNKRHPIQMGEPEVSAFLTYLAATEHVAASTQNQALSAILFLYREVLKLNMGWIEEIEWSKKPKRLPVVLAKAEVRMVLGRLEGSKWLMASLLYGTGMRLLECLRLRVKDLDFAYGQIVVRDTKGCEHNYDLHTCSQQRR